MRLAEACDAIVISNQRASKLNSRCDEKPVRRIAVLEMMELIGARRRARRERSRLDAGAREKSLDPGIDGNIEIDATSIDEQSDLPGRDGAQENGSASLPAAIDQGASRCAQLVAAAVEPKRNMRVEEDR
jgi:hypothetical protein